MLILFWSKCINAKKSKQMCPISSGFNSHSSKSSPECLKHFPQRHFYHAENQSSRAVRLWQCRSLHSIHIARPLLYPRVGGGQVSCFWGTRCKRARGGWLYSREFSQRLWTLPCLWERSKREVNQWKDMPLQATSVLCHCAKSKDIALSTKRKAEPPHHI